MRNGLQTILARDSRRNITTWRQQAGGWKLWYFYCRFIAQYHITFRWVSGSVNNGHIVVVLDCFHTSV